MWKDRLDDVTIPVEIFAGGSVAGLWQPIASKFYQDLPFLNYVMRHATPVFAGGAQAFAVVATLVNFIKKYLDELIENPDMTFKTFVKQNWKAALVAYAAVVAVGGLTFVAFTAFNEAIKGDESSPTPEFLADVLSNVVALAVFSAGAKMIGMENEALKNKLPRMFMGLLGFSAGGAIAAANHSTSVFVAPSIGAAGAVIGGGLHRMGQYCSFWCRKGKDEEEKPLLEVNENPNQDNNSNLIL